jgi:hypothetical protein
MANTNVPSAWANRKKLTEEKEEKKKPEAITKTVGAEQDGEVIIDKSKFGAAKKQAEIDAEYDRQVAEAEARKKERDIEKAKLKKAKEAEKAKKKAEKEAAKKK